MGGFISLIPIILPICSISGPNSCFTGFQQLYSLFFLITRQKLADQDCSGILGNLIAE